MSTRNYWLYTHNENSWQEFHTKGGGQVAGFANSRRKVVEKMQLGDYLLCYQKGSSRWIGVLEVIALPFYVDDEPLKDEDRIWHDVEFRNRVPVKVVVSLAPEKGVPMRRLLGHLSISGPKATSWTGSLRDNPREWKEADGEVIVNALLERYREEIEKGVVRDLTALQVEEGDERVIAGFEGGKNLVYTNRYERDKTLRTAAIRIHGTTCKGCGFNFAMIYGPRGEGYIEVRHLRPVSSLGGTVRVDPKEDMTVLCSNCHRMVHRHHNDVLTIEQLQALLRR